MHANMYACYSVARSTELILVLECGGRVHYAVYTSAIQAMFVSIISGADEDFSY